MALDFIAGCVGGCAGVLVGYPLDTVKVRLQTQDARKPAYRGTFHCIATIVQKESVHGLYKGMSSPMCSLAFINAIAFGVYGNVHRSFSDPNSLMSHMAAGAAAGTIQSIICSPMELTKTRLQLQGQEAITITPRFLHSTNTMYSYSSPLDCLLKTMQREGFRGLFKGLPCTILRDAPGFASYFGSFEILTRMLSEGENGLSTTSLLAAGGLAGIFSWIVTYPVDVIKSRLQADGALGPPQYTGLWDCCSKSYNKEGLKGFTQGLNSTLIRAFPTNAATFLVFSWVFNLFCQDRRAFDFPMDKHTKSILWEKEIYRVNKIACIDNFL
ncbi:mitochondrial basic amino acids transporter-like [Limulus polyphemus]|uniref:Mitochondrial basic amino acids transporter-like n=1 Tax=Limulus polyphemus TaxID=6850 RepID=A0ABM1BEV9_LIMPO|nr:mitochondrial basic amino acids transporter-like [Limulus polyphemus]